MLRVPTSAYAAFFAISVCIAFLLVFTEWANTNYLGGTHMGVQCNADGTPCSDGGYQILEMWSVKKRG